MKKNLITAILLATTGAFAQVGIGTTNPQTTFHIDGAKDNAAMGAPTVGQQANDFSVTATGDVGIGTTAPTAKLDVNGTIKISGGTPGLDKVLTSDAGGLASWKTTPTANTSTTGLLTSTDWNTFNNKVGSASNGVSIATGGVVELGGNLTKATTISNITGSNTLLFSGPTGASATQNSFTGFHNPSTAGRTITSFYSGSGTSLGYIDIRSHATGYGAPETFFDLSLQGRGVISSSNNDILIGTIGVTPTTTNKFVVFGTSNLERMRIAGNGDVSVGPAITAGAKLDVAGYIKVTGTDTTADAALTDGLIRYNSGTGKFQGRANGAWVDLH